MRSGDVGPLPEPLRLHRLLQSLVQNLALACKVAILLPLGQFVRCPVLQLCLVEQIARFLRHDSLQQARVSDACGLGVSDRLLINKAFKLVLSDENWYLVLFFILDVVRACGLSLGVRRTEARD